MTESNPGLVVISKLREKVNELERIITENNQAKIEVEDWRDTQKRVMSETCPSDEKHCTCVPMLKKALAEKDAIIAEASQKYTDLWNKYQKIKK